MTGSLNHDTPKERRHLISDFHRRAPFASFLPGIAGPDGTPMWCFYTNRGQGVASFGHSDKNHPILEFRPADQAYRDTSRLGFRTFLRDSHGTLREPFGIDVSKPGKIQREMSVGPADLKLTDDDGTWRTQVSYAGLPGEDYPGLIRHLRIINVSSEPKSAEVVDGLPRVVPHGIDNEVLKSMSTTASAWIETDVSHPKIPMFRIRAGIEDGAEVRPVFGSHFLTATAMVGRLNLPLFFVVDPASVFGSDDSFSDPELFRHNGLKGVTAWNPVLFGRFPSAFTAFSMELAPGQQADIYSLYGYTATGTHADFSSGCWDQAVWYQKKIEEYHSRVEEVTKAFYMKSAWPDLDAYTSQTALDNSLRGGMPKFWNRGDKSQVFYIYGRKHGDMERDYNEFALPASRYSAGFGNYRDMNQNRRIEVAIHPEIATTDIQLFMNLIQPDGYNPMIVRSGGFRREKGALNDGFKPDGDIFTPGDVWDSGVDQATFDGIMASSEYVPDALFGEGYWVDHWTYNLDLIDQYRRIYPDKLDSLFFGPRVYRWYSSGVRIRPLNCRYRLSNGDILPEDHLDIVDQSYRFLDQRSNLTEKLLSLAVVKYATLGPSECGLEMEAGRPGWNDSLNGMPSNFGSSLSDGAELLRLLGLLVELGTLRGSRELEAVKPLWELLDALPRIASLGDSHQRWRERWQARDVYRSALESQDLEIQSRSLGETARVLSVLWEGLNQRLAAAANENGGLLPAFFRHVPTGWEDLGQGYVVPSGFEKKVLPLFLEGAVKHMRIAPDLNAKQLIARRVFKSPLYDENLGMFTLNASLDDEPATLGRAKAFPDGWLENGSIWLHMEYKFLLELLRTGDGRMFWETAERCLIPFIENERYGRSPYENSSFIASSRHPVESVRGRGFVGRLSGATAEYLTMWSEFLLGQKPFILEDGVLIFRPTPILPAELFQDDGTLSFCLFGSTEVVYRNPERIDLYPIRGYRITCMTVSSDIGTISYTNHLPEKAAQELRRGRYRQLFVDFAASSPG